MPLDLVVVMPVYNEAECIASVLRDWERELDALEIRFQIHVLNDGSSDATASMLAPFEDRAPFRVTHKANSGHGPTILAGYRQAVEAATWVFQCDSDDEMRPEHFALLWSKREGFDALFGSRFGREQSAARRFITLVSRLVVRLLFRRGVRDVNVPYRLLRAAVLEPILARVPDDTFAPNILISGALARARVRIYNVAVPHEGRKTGQVSILKWKLWRMALRAGWQTLRFLPYLPALATEISARVKETDAKDK